MRIITVPQLPKLAVAPCEHRPHRRHGCCVHVRARHTRDEHRCQRLHHTRHQLVDEAAVPQPFAATAAPRVHFPAGVSGCSHLTPDAGVREACSSFGLQSGWLPPASAVTAKTTQGATSAASHSESSAPCPRRPSDPKPHVSMRTLPLPRGVAGGSEGSPGAMQRRSSTHSALHLPLCIRRAIEVQNNRALPARGDVVRR
jgi:hypothetical protein